MLSKPFSCTADLAAPHPQLSQGNQDLKVTKRAHALVTPVLRHALTAKLEPGDTGHRLELSKSKGLHSHRGDSWRMAVCKRSNEVKADIAVVLVSVIR